jgi:hypothetical protein
MGEACGELEFACAGVFWRWMTMNRAQVAAIERGLCGSLPQRCAAAASDAGLCRHQTPRADHVRQAGLIRANIP